VRIRRGAPLGLIIVLAFALRVPGLAHGLRHLPQQFERIFGLSVWQMVEARDFDQRNYLYPGFFFYLLYGPVALVRAAGLQLPDAYLACRVLVALFSVASVAVTFRLGSTLSGRRVGLLAALLLAVSPLEVQNAHWIRPDVVLETFALIALLAFRRVGRHVLGDVWAGAALGVATAVKFTGVFLAPAYLGYRMLAPGPKARRLLLAGAVSVLLFIVLSPYSVLSPRQFGSGAQEQLAYHYRERPDALGHLDLLLFYLKAFVLEIGPVGAACALVGAVIVMQRDRRTFGPLLAFPAVAVAVLATAHVGGARFLLPMGGLFAVLAAEGLEGLVSVSPLAALLAGGVAVLLPLSQSVISDREFRLPDTLDRTLDWIDKNLPPGSSILSTEKHLGVDRSRFHLKWTATDFWGGQPPSPADRTRARYVDLVVANPKDPTVQGFREVFRAESQDSEGRFDIGLYVPTPRREVPLTSVGLTASENEPLLSALRQGDGSGLWHTEGPGGPGSWIQIDFPSPVFLGRVELTLKNRLGPPLALRLTEDGREWKDVAALELDDGDAAPATQDLLLDPLCVRGVRVLPTALSANRWNVSALRLEEVADPLACGTPPH
jgi:hypothetical protein